LLDKIDRPRKSRTLIANGGLVMTWMRRIVAMRQAVLLLAVMLLVVAAAEAGDSDHKIDRKLMAALTESEDAVAPFFIVLGERADVKPAQHIADHAARGQFAVQALQATANRSQAGVRGFLNGHKVDYVPFWIENKIFVRAGSLELARELAQRPEVVALLPEVFYSVPAPQATTGGATQAIEWNITKIRADQVWTTSKGAGSVVANIDTGVQYNHPALVNQYRGYSGGVFNHTGNWKDATAVCGAAPCDDNGHGSHTMGTMVGSDGTNLVGVAPGAKWIACKACKGTTCASSALTACAQWIMDPFGNGTGTGRPDVVNNSWGGAGGNSWYQSYVQNWRAAGIFPAFSIGNSGPNCATASSPGDYPESFGSGATDSNDVIASFSSRGPSAFSSIIKPDATAPGVSIRSSVPTNTFAVYSGTSVASPHSAGTVALVWSAVSSYKGNVAATQSILTSTAFPIGTTQTCGSISAGSIPNDTYGSGRIDALNAVNKAKGARVAPPPSVTITAPANGTSYNCTATVNFTAVASDPTDGNLTGYITWTDNGAAIARTGGSVSVTYGCTAAGNHTITAKVTDRAGLSDTDSITISIVNLPPPAPSNLTAALSGTTGVLLKWTDNAAGNEDGFRVERKGGSTWNLVATVPRGVTTCTDTPGKGNFSYRVSAYKGTLVSAPSNVVTIKR
jgi:hypothetical protein